MDIIYNVCEWKEPAIVATVGFFDGVHSGHRFLLDQMQRLAAELHLPAAVITFPVHPRIILQSDYHPELLNSLDEKLERLAETGVDYAVVMDFTPELAAFTARRFITEILSKQWRVKALLTGYDHRFGRQREEGYEQYAKYGEECGMKVVRIEEWSGAGEAVSSSTARRMILQGKVSAAAGLLGYNYRLKGHVTGGDRIGRSIGFPTANIEVEAHKVIPHDGAYSVWITVDGIRHGGMLYAGARPTIGEGGKKTVEVNIFDFSDDIYGKFVEIEFVDFIRENSKFANLDALRGQLQADRQKAIEILH